MTIFEKGEITTCDVNPEFEETGNEIDLQVEKMLAPIKRILL